MAEPIGKGRCPLCGSSTARVSLSKSQLACLTCSGCQCQVFARGDKADELLRALVSVEPIPAAPTDAELRMREANGGDSPAAGFASAAAKVAAPADPPPKPKKKGTGTAFDALLNLGGEA